MSDRAVTTAAALLVGVWISSCAWLDEMREPDRTITIVSIIGLVIIWGSVAYHKFVQGGAALPSEEEPSEDGNGPSSQPQSSSAAAGAGNKKSKKRR